jgi:site-specific recombinase XerC
MRDLNYALKQLCHRNRDGSFATQADRERILDLIADQLHDMGFRHMEAGSLKPKHVEKLVERWLAEALSPGTIKNRMSALRWWAEKVGKQNVVARTNAEYGIADRVYVTNQSKAKALNVDQLAQIRDPYVCMSLRLQAELGLRREESIKIVPSWADRGDRLVLGESWCKGGREREIPIQRLEQRQVIDEAKALANGKSLVASGYATYAAYLKHFRYECERVGIHGVHGHRHLCPGALPGTRRLGMPCQGRSHA